MKNTHLLTDISRSLHKIGFQLKKHSPSILVGVGIVGAVTSTVLACKATTKASKVVEKSKEDIKQIRECMADESLITTGEYSEQDGKKDLTMVYARTSVELVKLYAPAAIVGTLSIASILASHAILNKRNVALASAYAVVDKSFKDYRKRVKQRYGNEAEHDIRFGLKSEEVKVFDEDGKESTVVVKSVDKEWEQPSDYVRIFDEFNENWKREHNYNLYFLKQQERYFNDLLRAKGVVFWNEVLEGLGFPRVPEGQMIGWVYDKDNIEGDNYISFGIFEYPERTADFINGINKSVMLEFNIQGNVMQRLA